VTGIADIKALRRRVRRRLAAEDGVVSIEFVMWISLYIFVFLASVEAGVLLARVTMLDRALDIAVRDVRLGIGDIDEHDELVDRICDNTMIIKDCDTSLHLELRPVSTVTWEPLNSSTQCVDRTGDITPVMDFRIGGENELMLVRACAVVDPIFPTTGLGLRLPKDASGGYRMVVSSAFVNEPR